jgi:hypothetical protein
MNKQLDIVARVLFGLAYNSDEEGKGANVKSLDEYRHDAAPVLVALDNATFSRDSVTEAIISAGFEPDQYLEQFLKVIEELQKVEVVGTLTLAHMEKAWATGHENGFWDGRHTDAQKPSAVPTTELKSGYTMDDVIRAQAEGYVSGWFNGVLSSGSLPDDPAKMPLLGAEHGKANNPYSKTTGDNNAE